MLIIINIAGVCGDEKTGEGKKVTMALTEAFTYYEEEEEEDEEDEVERARIACQPTQVCDSGEETDDGEDTKEWGVFSAGVNSVSIMAGVSTLTLSDRKSRFSSAIPFSRFSVNTRRVPVEREIIIVYHVFEI